jgi:hypothetical protein
MLSALVTGMSFSLRTVKDPFIFRAFARMCHSSHSPSLHIMAGTSDAVSNPASHAGDDAYQTVHPEASPETPDNDDERAETDAKPTIASLRTFSINGQLLSFVAKQMEFLPVQVDNTDASFDPANTSSESIGGVIILAATLKSFEDIGLRSNLDNPATADFLNFVTVMCPSEKPKIKAAYYLLAICIAAANVAHRLATHL